MERYVFDIEERLVKRVSVQAPSQEAAQDLARKLYVDGFIKLDQEEDFEEFGAYPVEGAAEGTVAMAVEIKTVGGKEAQP